MRLLSWLFAQYEWPAHILAMRLRKEWDNRDVFLIPTYELQSEYDSTVRSLEHCISIRLRYGYACRIAAILVECQRRNVTLIE